VLAFGSAALLTLIGVLCAIVIRGLTGQLLTMVLVSLGLGGVVLLVFLEVGLSEDRELARQERQRQARAEQRRAPRRVRFRRRPD